MDATLRKKSKKERNAEREANKKAMVQHKLMVRSAEKEVAKKEELKATQPIGGKCPECGLRIRTNSMEKHKAGISHKNRLGAKRKK